MGALAARSVLVALSAAGTLGLLLVAPGASVDTTFPLLALALVPLLALVIAPRDRGELPVWAVVVPSVLLVAVAVLIPPRNSRDVWSYAMYGRILAEHHANPYLSAPSAFVHDVFLSRVAEGWRGTASVYGPGFTALSAVIMAIVGSSAAAARIAFQGLAGAAMLASVALLARSGVRSGGLVPIALNPLLIVWMVNGGHNDALVGLALLAAAVALSRERVVAAGVFVGAALLVKAVAILPLVALGWWIWRRHGTALAARFAAVAALPVVVAYAAFGGTAAVRPLLASSGLMSRASVWRFLVTVLPPSERAATLRHLGLLIVVAVLVVTGAALVRPLLGQGSPSSVVARSLLGYLLVGAYVLPWYLGWALPAAALERRSKAMALLLVQSSVLLVAYQYQVSRRPDRLDSWLRLTGYAGGSLFLAISAAFLLAAVFSLGRGLAAQVYGPVRSRTRARTWR